MAETITPNLSLTKPEIGASNNVWGARLNDNFDILDQRTVRQTVQWTITMGDDTPESLNGKWILSRYGNNGIIIDNPIIVNRQSGLVTAHSLTVLGATTINGAIAMPGGVEGDLGITGGLGIGGNVAIVGNLNVGGISTTDSLVVTNAAQIGGNLTATLHVSAGSVAVVGDASVGGDFAVTGKVTKALNMSHLAAAAPVPPADTAAVYFDTNGNPVVRRPDGTIAHLGVPPGTIAFTGGNTADVGWMLCNGQALSRENYPALFAKFGVIHGSGNGVDTFNIPDLRGRVIAHVDGGAGRLTANGLGTAAVLSAEGGDDWRVMTVAQMPAHTHIVDDPKHAHTVAGTNRTVQGGSGDSAHRITDFPGNVSGLSQEVFTGIHLDPTGGGQPHSVVQPTFVLNAQVKLG